MSDPRPIRGTTNVVDPTQPLLVPKGYVPPPYQGPGAPGMSGSREPVMRAGMGSRTTPEQIDKTLYHEGDQHKPAGWETNDIIVLQQKLVVAGLLDPNKGFDLGVWGPTTEAAYATLLGEANAAGVDADTMFTHMAQNRIAIGGKGKYTLDPETGQIILNPDAAGAANAIPLTLNLPNREDVARTMRSAIIDKLGQGWTPAQVDEMVNAYEWKTMQLQVDFHDQQVRQAEAMAAGKPDPGAVLQSAPSAEAFIEDKLRKEHPVEMQAQSAINQFVDNATGFWKSPV